MADEEAAILARAKALAAEDGFTWEFNFGAPAAPRAKLRHQRFLSKDQQQHYLARAKVAQRLGKKIGQYSPVASTARPSLRSRWTAAINRL